MAIILLSFTPISLTIGLVFAEALTTANLLATAEALITPKTISENSSDPDVAPDIRKTRGFKGFFCSLFHKRISHKNNSHERILTRNEEDASVGTSVDSSRKQDEYQDEDIDDRYTKFYLSSSPVRAEKIADIASLSIPWGRQWTYTLRALAVRLQLPESFFNFFSLNSQSLLPIPFASSRLVEVCLMCLL